MFAGFLQKRVTKCFNIVSSVNKLVKYDKNNLEASFK